MPPEMGVFVWVLKFHTSICKLMGTTHLPHSKRSGGGIRIWDPQFPTQDWFGGSASVGSPGKASRGGPQGAVGKQDTLSRRQGALGK